MKIVDKLNNVLPSVLILMSLILGSIEQEQKAIILLLSVCAIELIRIKK